MDHLRRAADHATAPHHRLTYLARALRHAGVARGDVDAAAALYEQAEAVVQAHGLGDDAVREAYRAVARAMGDARVAAGRGDAALEDYRAAEALARPRVPDQVRHAQVGAMPGTLQGHLRAGNINDAQMVVERWYERFPSSVVEHELLHWAGRVALADGRAADAVRPLELARQVREVSPHEAATLWYLAEAYAALEMDERRAAVLRELVDTGLVSEYRRRALAALEDE